MGLTQQGVQTMMHLQRAQDGATSDSHDRFTVYGELWKKIYENLSELLSLTSVNTDINGTNQTIVDMIYEL